jgi:hypothetical protein
MAKIKTFTITSTNRRTGGSHNLSGTLPELIKSFSYTLECGYSWQHEDGNKKINKNPRGIKSLVTNLNNATNNSAANGYSNTEYELKEMFN